MTIDKQKLKALTDRVKTDRRFCADENHHALADGVQALLAEIEENAMHMRAFGEVMRSQAEQIGKLKAENEALRQAMRKVMEQVDGNIRETVRDCVNGHDDVQDIYGYCDTIDEIIEAALAKEESHD